MGMSFFITDEIFGISIARQGYLNPLYTYGAALVAAPCWATGTALGIIAGSALPLRVVSALGVALYGMFIAIKTPPVYDKRIIKKPREFLPPWLFGFIYFLLSS